ncbi:MAG: hypothetical protein Q7S83_00565 [bacterium]|nr:hypothetical protein [bacterium]
MKVIPAMDYPIRPEDIDTERSFQNAFGHFEAEETARAIVRFFQREGDWGPFTRADVIEFAPTELWPVTQLIKGPHALGAKFIERDECDEKVHYVTGQFIERCHQASPADKRV